MKYLENESQADSGAMSSLPTLFNGGASSRLEELARQQRRDLRDTHRQQTREFISAAISELRVAKEQGYLDQKNYDDLMKLAVGAMVGHEVINIVEDFFD